MTRPDKVEIRMASLVAFIAQPSDAFRLGDFLVESLKSLDWTEFRAAVAFVKRSGTKHVSSALAEFSKRASVNITAGIDSNGTSAEGLQDLISAVSRTGKLWIFHNANSSTFHPKIYLFKNATNAEIVIGSGNLTEGGLYTNYEANIRFKLDLKVLIHRSILTDVETALNSWSAPVAGICLRLDDALLKKLMNSGRVLAEALTREIEERGPDKTVSASSKQDSLFKVSKVRPAPKPLMHSSGVKLPKKASTSLSASSKRSPSTATARTFVMTLQNTDVGYGQKTPGAQARAAEIFVPIRAVDADPAFWGWPNLFTVDKKWSAKHATRIASKMTSARRSKRPLDKMDRYRVRIRTAKPKGVVTATIWYNPEKVDLRIRHEQLRAAGTVGDILAIRAAAPGADYDYDFEVIARADSRFASLDSACNVKVAANSKKRFGYI
jgi:HKD family nuclease